MKGRQVTSALESNKLKKCEHGVKEDMRKSFILPSLRYASKTWTWHVAWQSEICIVEMSCGRGACSVSM